MCHGPMQAGRTSTASRRHGPYAKAARTASIPGRGSGHLGRLCYHARVVISSSQKLAGALLAVQLLVPLVWAPLRLVPAARECGCSHASKHCTACACPVPRTKPSQPHCHGSAPGAQCAVSAAGKSSPVALLTVLDELFRGANVVRAAEPAPPGLHGTARRAALRAVSLSSPAPPTPPPQRSFRVV